MILEPALVGFGTEGSDLYEADPEQAARLLRRAIAAGPQNSRIPTSAKR